DDLTQEYSNQEKLILNLISQGLGNKEVAYQLKVSEVTVKASLRTIFTKLGAKNRASAITLAVSRGVITIDHL
ncbi:LuxR C-terminal-related transcriptional regulator, partial [Yoonia sp.]|nr:LuxR C-terminal-related transcriptional regulator [Yoonia sp.]